MNLIDRYVHEIGRHLPRGNRSDIQAELRSALNDALEDKAGPKPSEREIAAILREFGPPKQVADSYNPRAKYLIGPALYPLFRMVAGITVVAVLGAHALAWAVAIFIAQDPVDPLQALAGLVNGVPAALGMVVIVFAILQRFGVRLEGDEEDWDPENLPEIVPGATLKRGERIFGVVAGILILVILVFFPEWIGFITAPGGEFYPNPVIPQFLGWIILSLLVNLGLDLYLLSQGRWETGSRVAKIAANLLSIGVLGLLIQGHTTWLQVRGANDIIATLERLPENLDASVQILGMQAFRFAFSVALIVTIIDTAVILVRLVRSNLGDEAAAQGFTA
jgi:hypothetical protein